jgi:hypothetical protein
VRNALPFLLSIGIATSALGQTVVQPIGSNKAIQIAELMRPKSTASADIERMRQTVANNILRTTIVSLGPGCDPNVAACKDAANRLALKAVQNSANEQRALAVNALAIMLDYKLSAAEQDEVLGFLKRLGGASFASALIELSDQRNWSPEIHNKLARLYQDSATTETRSSRSLQEQFFNETKALPRRTVMLPPSPPAPRSPNGGSK